MDVIAECVSEGSSHTRHAAMFVFHRCCDLLQFCFVEVAFFLPQHVVDPIS